MDQRPIFILGTDERLRRRAIGHRREEGEQAGEQDGGAEGTHGESCTRCHRRGKTGKGGAGVLYARRGKSFSNVGLAASTSLASTNVLTNSAGDDPAGLMTSMSRPVTRTSPT